MFAAKRQRYRWAMRLAKKPRFVVAIRRGLGRASPTEK
jgi:hypothetical protein